MKLENFLSVPELKKVAFSLESFSSFLDSFQSVSPTSSSKRLSNRVLQSFLNYNHIRSVQGNVFMYAKYYLSSTSGARPCTHKWLEKNSHSQVIVVFVPVG